MWRWRIRDHFGERPIDVDLRNPAEYTQLRPRGPTSSREHHACTRDSPAHTHHAHFAKFKVLTTLLFSLSLALSGLAQFTPGDMFRGTDSGIFRIPPGGGDFSATTPYSSNGSSSYGQFTWKPDLSVGYFTDFLQNRVFALAPDGSATQFGTLQAATGILWTSDGRLLVAQANGGTVRDMTAGGAGLGAPIFAQGFNHARNLVQTSDGRILLVDYKLNDSRVYDITNGGDFSAATPFAVLPGFATCIAEDASGRIWCGLISGGAGLYNITAGGTFVAADAYVTSGSVIGVACSADGRIYAVAITSPIIRDVTDGGLFGNCPEYARVNTGTSDSALSIVPVPKPAFAVQTEVLIAKGSPVPGAGTGEVAAGAVFRSVGIPALNEDNFFAFAGSWSAGGTRHGIFVMDALDLEAFPAPPIAVSGAPIPGNPDVRFGSFAAPLITDTNEVAFLSSLSGAPKPQQQALFTNIGGTLQIVAQAGSAAPGADGATFKKIRSVVVGRPSVSQGGDATAPALYFTATLTHGSGEPQVSKLTDLGLWKWSGGTVQLLLRKGSAITGSQGNPVAIKSFSAITSRKSGASTSGQGHGAEHYFVDYLWTRIQTADGGKSIAYLDWNGFLTQPYRRGDIAPESGGALFKSFGLPAQNIKTAGAFLAELNGPGVTRATNKAIFAEDDNFSLHRIATTGDSAPGYADGIFSKLRDPVTASVGRVAFTARVSGGGITALDDDGIWVASVCGCEQEQIAREGAQPPGVPAGAAWRGFSDLALPESPLVGPLFVGRLTVPKADEPNPAGITKTNDTGFWITDPSLGVHLAIREGDQMQVGGVTKTVKGFKPLAMVSGSPAQTRSHNGDGALVYQVFFTDTSTAIVRTELIPDFPNP